MSGTYVVHLVPGASKLLARVMENDVPLTAPGDVVTNSWPHLSGGYLRLDHNSGGLEWSSALVAELVDRGLARRFRHLSTWNWETKFDPRDLPFAFLLDGDAVMNLPPGLPKGDPRRKKLETRRAELQRAAKELFDVTRP